MRTLLLLKAVLATALVTFMSLGAQAAPSDFGVIKRVESPKRAAKAKKAVGKRANGKKAVSKGKKAKAAQQDSSLGTDFSFDNMRVAGKYQYSDEANATVEDEKVMEDLLGMRMDFKDRLQKETKRR